MEKGLGRLTAPDERDRGFALAPPMEAAKVEKRYWITRSPAFDQGATSQCVAYSGNRWLTTNPVINKPLDFGQLYHECQLVDEWPGENYDGTSVRALFKVLKRLGYLDEYNWAWDAELVANWVLAMGPMVVGTAWTQGMFYPDPKTGFISPTGRIVGGHAYTIIGADRVKRRLRLINSWGPGWGQKGRAWIDFENFDSLMRNGGEACTAKEKLLGR